MQGYMVFLLAYAGPFIGLAILYLVWAHTAAKLQHRYPGLYAFAEKMHNNLPKISAVIIIGVVIIMFFTQPSYYEW